MITGPDPIRAPAWGLTWPIKRQFLRYIAGMADGRCSVTDGAELAWPPSAATLGHGEEQAHDRDPRESADRFHFDFTDLQVGAQSTTVVFRGDVRFSGHHGFLFVRIADPAITVDPDGNGVLTTAGSDPTDPASGRLSLARLRVSRSDGWQAQSAGQRSEAWTGTEVRLTAEGSEVFGGAYAESDPLDDLELVISLSEGRGLIPTPAICGPAGSAHSPERTMRPGSESPPLEE